MKHEYLDLSKCDKYILDRLYEEVKLFVSQNFRSACNPDGIEMFLNMCFGKNNPKEKKMFLLREKDELIGLYATQVYEYIISNRLSIVVRGQIAITNLFRGHSLFADYFIYDLLQVKFNYPEYNIMYYASCMIPSSYRFLAKYFPEIYPSGRYCGSDTINGILQQIASLQKQVVENGCIDNTFLIKNPCASKVSANDIKDFQNNPNVSFYLKANPRYTEGYGLLVIVPITFENLYHAIYFYEKQLSSQIGHVSFNVKELKFPFKSDMTTNFPIFLSSDSCREHYDTCKKWLRFESNLKTLKNNVI